METEMVVLMITTLGSVAGSALVVIQVVLGQMNKLEGRIDGRIDRLENKFEDKFTSLDAKFEDKFTSLDAKFDVKFDALGRDVADIRERLARVEGHLMAPSGFTLRRARPTAADEPPPEDPAAGRCQAS